MKTPDILNSKIKKIRIELPHYSFSHSSSSDSHHPFIGRERIKDKLRKVIEDSPDEPGVYLIAGNRGVGKTSYVNEVIKETSLHPKSVFTENFKYLLLLLIFVTGTQFCFQELQIFINKTWAVLFGLSFIILCYSNSYRHYFTKKNIIYKIWDSFTSVIKELRCFINPYNPYGKTQYVVKIILVVSFTQVISIIPYITPVIAFFGYIVFVLFCMFLKYVRNKQHEYKQKFSKNSFIFLIKNILISPIWKYIKNHNRFYLCINFGHKLKDEKDILRLITRTLNTEYSKYLRTFRRMLPRRIIVFSILYIFAFLFSPIIEKQGFYKKLIKESVLYNASSQILFNYPALKDRNRLKGVFSRKDSSLVITKVEKIVDRDDEILSKTTTQEPKIEAKIGNVGVFLLVIDQVIYEVTKIIKKSPNYFLRNEGDNKFIFPIYYLHWILFFLMYIFYKLLLHCTLITHFFYTHQIIKKRLKKLNSDITHSTERENSIGINNEKNSPVLGMKTKKSRNIADAREIEKELQDILGDIQRIPVLMCRPNIVIVFDELDKVEPGDTVSEKETPQTKASLFSIEATRDRQTEILRILSNMKYFLSTARAKFIFIAGREMFDIHLADVSERNNYIGSIFNVVILVPSFLTDHHSGKKTLPQESSIASLPEEFVCRKLFPHDYHVKTYNLKNYRVYLKNVIYKDIHNEQNKKEIIEKIIAVLQQFIIYLAHVSKGAPKKMTQLFESFIEIRNDRDKNREDDFLVVQNYNSSRHFLSFNYYKQYTIGILAYLITPVFFRLAESNIKEHSDKLLVSSLRFVDFLFKFHKHSFSWKILDISPEMLEVNRAPELKSVVVDLLNFLAQVHINKSNFNLSEYRFDSLIANEIFAMAKTDEVFSALFSFSLDEMLPLKKHYLDLLEKTEKEYQNKKKSTVNESIDAISSLQVVLGDICYYNDELEEAEVYYKSVVQAFSMKELPLEQFYVYVRNLLRLGIIYEKRKQYDFAYMTYGGLCERIIQRRTKSESECLDNTKDNNILFERMTFEGLKMIYLPFIAKLQILEHSHMGGITCNHLTQLDENFRGLTSRIINEGVNLLKAEFYSRVADILFYKNSDLNNNKNDDIKILPKNTSCTACEYYSKALYTLLEKGDINKPNRSKILKLLVTSIEEIKNNYNMKFCTILARILSDWGNVFFSCDNRCEKINNEKCYICDEENNTRQINISKPVLEKYINFADSESNEYLKEYLNKNIEDSKKKISKMEIVFAMYSISLHAYCKANLYKRSAYQIYKMLCLFKHYEIYNYMETDEYIKKLSEKAIHYLWYANEDLNVLELNKRKKDFNKKTVKEKIHLPKLLLDCEITRIWVTVNQISLKLVNKPEELKKYYKMRITSPYKINYSIEERIYRLWLKSKINYKTYQLIVEKSGFINNLLEDEYVLKKDDFGKILNNPDSEELVNIIFGNRYNIIQIFENLIAETIYCLIDIAQLSETMGETYVFTNSFIGSIHASLSFWIRLFESYEIHKKEIDFKNEYGCKSHINDYFKKYLDEEWREQLSGYRENQLALSYYYKCLEMHNEGRAYHNRIDTMCYLIDEYNDRSDHFNIAEERNKIVNGIIDKNINEMINLYKGSKIYKVKNYLGK